MVTLGTYHYTKMSLSINTMSHIVKSTVHFVWNSAKHGIHKPTPHFMHSVRPTLRHPVPAQRCHLPPSVGKPKWSLLSYHRLSSTLWYVAVSTINSNEMEINKHGAIAAVNIGTVEITDMIRTQRWSGLDTLLHTSGRPCAFRSLLIYGFRNACIPNAVLDIHWQLTVCRHLWTEQHRAILIIQNKCSRL